MGLECESQCVDFMCKKLESMCVCVCVCVSVYFSEYVCVFLGVSVCVCVSVSLDLVVRFILNSQFSGLCKPKFKRIGRKNPICFQWIYPPPLINRNFWNILTFLGFFKLDLW